ncbi:MAG: substrate-binding domain-containing protein [Arcobacteraceae bacterium]|jgi:ribose transport system substrate-binding protein|nr:substrate-binding domain-containing protein [Arcobacteraceae bacterium]
MIKILILITLGINLFASSDFKIAALYWSMNIEGQVAMKKGVEAQVEVINKKAKQTNKKTITLIEYVAGDGEAGMENQLKQFRDAIAKKVDAIVVQPTDNAVLIPALKEANKAHIPVIAYDQYISQGILESFVTSDNYQAGFLNGEYVAHLFKGKKQLSIALVEYPYVSSTIDRVDGFIDALEKYKIKYKIVKRYEAVEPKKGKEVGLAILKDFPKKGSLDLTFCINDGGCLSVVNEFLNENRLDIAVATVDGDPKSVKLLQENKLIKIDSAQFCGPIGSVALQTAYEKLLGKKIKKIILVPVFPITKETQKLYPGWLGPIPQKFKKPWYSQTPIWDNTLKGK